MTVLPVVERELLVASRHKGTYWGRFAAGLAGAGIAAGLFQTMKGPEEKEIGIMLIYCMSAVIFLYALVAGILSTCDCLSEEKREGTLGLLFLTDLKGYDVVLGKLAASSLHTLYGMLALVPMLAIPFILGGVDLAEMLRVVVVSINLLLFSLGAGLFASSICRRDHWAMSAAGLIGLFILTAGPIASNFPPFAQFSILMNLSPANGCFLAFDALYNLAPASNHFAFWENAAITQIYFLVFFFAACRIVPQSWQDAAFGQKSSRRQNAAAAGRIHSRRELLDINPFLWRAARDHKRWVMPAALVAIFMMWLGVCRLMHLEPMEESMDFLFFIAAGFVLKLWMATAAARTFSEDRRNGGFELLLSTPISEGDIIRGQLAALWRQFAWPLAGILVLWGAFTLVGARHITDRAEYFEWRIYYIFFLGADLAALGWDGMWLGLISRKPNRGAWLAFFRIVALPTLVWCVAFIVFVIAKPNLNDRLPKVALNLAILIALVTDMLVGVTSALRLHEQFRAIAAQGLERKAPPAPARAPTPALVEAS